MTVTPAAILWPLRFSAESYTLVVRYQSVTETLVFYPYAPLVDLWWSGAEGLLQSLADCLSTHSEALASVFDVELVDFRVRVTNTLDNGFRLLWDDPATTLDKTIFGFAESMAVSVAVTAPNMPQGIWRPRRFLSKDSRERQSVVGSVSKTITGLVRTARLALPSKEREFSFELVGKARALAEFAETTEPYNTLETAWLEAISLGREFRLCEDETDLETFTTYKTRDLEDPLKQRTSNLNYWDVAMRVVKV